MNRTYVPLADCRHLDTPIGDPHGFGRRDFPFIVGPAVGTLATAVTAGVAAAGGTMAVVGAVASIATMAGLAMTVVGAVTGDEDLMKIGGYVGLAGGVTGLATSAFSAGTSVAAEAASAANQAAPAASGVQGAMGGLGGSTSAMESAITPAFQGAGQALTAPAQSAIQTGGQMLGGAGLLGKAGTSAAQEALTPALSTGLGSDVGAGLGTSLGKVGADVGADLGKDLGANLGKASSYTPKSDGSFFDFITGGLDSKGGWEAVKIGGSVLEGMAKSDATDKQTQLLRDKYEYDKASKERAYTNANTQGKLNLGFNAPSQAQRDKAQLDAAELARKKASILTAPAKT
jgi:hypothetical protein